MSSTDCRRVPATPARPTARRAVRPAWLGRHRWCGELLLLAALYGVYELVRALTHTGLDRSLANGRRILHLEQLAHLAPEHGLNAFFTHTPAVAVPACFLYATGHYLVTPAVLIWLWRARPELYRGTRSVLAVATLVALLGFWLLPTAPPRSIGGFTDTMAQWSHVGWWGGAGSVPQGLEGFTDQAGAMPSLHVGWAVWCGWALWRGARRRWVRALAVAYPTLTVLTVVGTANHYVADAAAGILVIAASMGLVALAVRLQARRLVDRLIRETRPVPDGRRSAVRARVTPTAAGTPHALGYVAGCRRPYL